MLISWKDFSYVDYRTDLWDMTDWQWCVYYKAVATLPISNGLCDWLMALIKHNYHCK